MTDADILRYLERRVSAAADAAELAGDVFRVAWQKYDPDAAPPRAWLFGVARNVRRPRTAFDTWGMRPHART